MKIHVLFFGATADAANRREIECSLEENSTVAKLTEGLIEVYPNLNQHKLLFAVDQEYVPNQTILKDGDELAIFTAVSGG